MKGRIALISTVLIVLLHAIESQADQPNQIALVPQPSSVVRRAGTFELTPGGPVRREQTGGGGPYCIGNEATFACLEGVLAEVIDLFPSRYIHVGGDEVEKTNWKKCPKCQARLCRKVSKTKTSCRATSFGGSRSSSTPGSARWSAGTISRAGWARISNA